MKELVLKIGGVERKLSSLEGLLSLVMETGDNGAEEIAESVDAIVEWVEENFPKQLVFAQQLRQAKKEFTAQQTGELIARELRKILAR